MARGQGRLAEATKHSKPIEREFEPLCRLIISTTYLVC